MLLLFQARRGTVDPMVQRQTQFLGDQIQAFVAEFVVGACGTLTTT